MLIQISANIVVMVLDSILVHNFHGPAVARAKNVIIFGVDNSSSLLIDNKNKNILVRGEGTTQGLDNTIITAGDKYPINFTEFGKIFVFSLHYNGSNSFSFVNITKIYQFKAKDSEINPYALCVGNIYTQLHEK